MTKDEKETEVENRCCKSPKRTMVFGLFIMTLGLLLSACLIGSFAKPYQYTKNFQKTTCNVLTSALLGNVTCNIGGNDYPCVSVTVNYSSNGVPYTGLVMDNYDTGLYQKDPKQCSMYHCPDYDYPAAVKDVEAFRSSNGVVGQTFTCYTNPGDTTEVILQQIPTPFIVHVTVWPLVMAIVGIVITVLAVTEKSPCFEKRERKDNFVVQQQENSSRPRTSESALHGEEMKETDLPL